MPGSLLPLPVALLLTTIQVCALLGNFNLALPPRINGPKLTAYTGRYTYLTVQTNIILLVYYAVTTMTSILETRVIDGTLIALYPLVFALGSFVTIAYYLLDHWNPEQIKKRITWAKRGYNFLEFDSHLEHGFAFPGVVLYQYAMVTTASSYRPSYSDVVMFVGGYMLFFLAFTHVIKHLTGVWVYPIIEDVSRFGGIAGRWALFATLMLVFMGLGSLGKLLIA